MPRQLFYHGDVPVLQPRGQLGAVGEHLEECGSQGAVVVPPHPPEAAKPAGHFCIALQQQHMGNHRGPLRHEGERKELDLKA